MEIRTSGDYMGRLAGMCGNCNGDVADDFRDNDGTIQEDSDKGRRNIASSYVIWISSTVFDSPHPPPPPPSQLKALDGNHPK